MVDPARQQYYDAFMKQAREQDWPAVAERGRQARNRWNLAAEGLTADDAPDGPQDGDWSPWHLYNHAGAWLANSVRAFARAARGESTNLGTKQAWTEGEHTLADLQSACDANWDAFLAALPTEDPNDDTIVITHRFFGDLTPRQYATFALSHLETHVGQMRELRGMEAETGGSG